MTFEEISKEMQRLVDMHKQYTSTLVSFYEKSLAAQVATYTAEIEKAQAEAAENMKRLETALKNAGGKM